MRYRITLSYDGAPFSGWQIQPNAPSVQACLQQALSTLLREEIAVTGAGRTDAEVNGICYCAHFDSVATGLETAGFIYKLNAILPHSVVIHEVRAAAPDFHARFDASRRSYRYFLHRVKDPFAERFSWQCGFPLDLGAMNEAASLLPGTRDFSCFEKTGGSNKTSICTIWEAVWTPYTPDHVRMMGFPAREGDYLVFHIEADRFLRNMVRAIVGTLIDIGRGRHDPGWMSTLLESGDRCSAGESVPGHALFLDNVIYPEI